MATALVEAPTLRGVEELFGSRDRENRRLPELQIKTVAPRLIEDIEFIITSLPEFPSKHLDFASLPHASFDFDIERLGKNLQITHLVENGERVFSFILGNDRSKKEGTIDAKHGVIRCSGFYIDSNGKIHQEEPLEGTPRTVEKIENIFISLFIPKAA